MDNCHSMSSKILSFGGALLAGSMLGNLEVKKSLASDWSTIELSLDSSFVMRVHLAAYISAKKSEFFFSSLQRLLNGTASSSITQTSRNAYKHSNALPYWSLFIEEAINRLIKATICSTASSTRSFLLSPIVIFLKSATGLTVPISFIGALGSFPPLSSIFNLVSSSSVKGCPSSFCSSYFKISAQGILFLST